MNRSRHGHGQGKADHTHTALIRALGLESAEWSAVREAAHDAHLPVKDYCRLMVLAAAGMGGVTEHLERAIAASAVVDQTPGLLITARRVP